MSSRVGIAATAQAAAVTRRIVSDRPLGEVPAARPVAAGQVLSALRGARRLVVLDDDPTGTQTVRDLPVLTGWAPAEVRWALGQHTPGFYVLTNTRSLPSGEAAQRNREVAAVCLAAADELGLDLAFASRGDSTLRGHFPEETDALTEVCASAGRPIDAVVLSPAYIDAGRVTVDSVHWLLRDGRLTPVGASEFARDATFGYASSHLADWVAEKTGGRIRADEVETVTLGELRSTEQEPVLERLRGASRGRIVVADALSDDDLRALVLDLLAVEGEGRRFVYRVGPSFVRARVGQAESGRISDVELREIVLHGRERADAAGSPSSHGLVVVGSHVGVTTRQLERLRQTMPFTEVRLDVATLLDGGGAEDHRGAAVVAAVAALAEGPVVFSTSRDVVTSEDPAESLRIARLVSAAVTRSVREIAEARRPAFVVAKGGITSSDVATGGLGIRRAWVRGPVLDGIVSLWEPIGGPFDGLPYVVFAGNVGGDAALAEVMERLVVV